MISTKVKLVPKILQQFMTEEEWRGNNFGIYCRERLSLKCFEALATWPGTTLRIRGQHIYPEYTEALVKWKGHTLHLHYNIIDLESIKALVNWGGHTFKLYSNRIGDLGAKALAKWKGHTLDLGYNDIGDEGAGALAKWKGHTLDLTDNNIGDLGAKALAEWPGHILKLGNFIVGGTNHIGNEGARLLAEKWSGHTLNLSLNHISDKGAKVFVKWGGTILDLSHNNIGDSGVKILAKKWRGISLYLNGPDGDGHDSDIENAEVKKRYEESVKILLGEYLCKDIITYVLWGYLE